MSLRARLLALEQRFSERNASRELEKLLDAFSAGNCEALYEQECIETAASGRQGWVGNLLACVVRPLEGGDLIAPEDLRRPEA